MPKQSKETPKKELSRSDTKPQKTKLKPNIKARKTVIWIAIWVAVLLVVGLISFTISRNSALAANKKAEAALSALKANDDTAFYNLGSTNFKKASDQKKVKAVVNEWSKVISQATNGQPELVSKQTSTTKDGKNLTTLVYKYQVQPGKSKINQKELFVQVVVEQTDDGYKLATFNIDTQKK